MSDHTIKKSSQPQHKRGHMKRKNGFCGYLRLDRYHNSQGHTMEQEGNGNREEKSQAKTKGGQAVGPVIAEV